MAAASSTRGASVSTLRSRAALLRAIRAHFDQAGFVEVETPLRLDCPPNEPHIDAEPSGDSFLRTSPELHLKRLLAEGMDRVYELGPCFRRGERGTFHHPEYAMLEWYRAPGGYLDVLADAENLLCAVAARLCGGCAFVRAGVRVDLTPPWPRWTVSETFRRLAGWDPVAAFDPDRFDLDLVGKIEPALPADRPTVLIDYPVEAAAMARCAGGPRPVAERWELYLCGMELANAFSELTDAAEQAARFERWAGERRGRGQAVYPADAAFLDALPRMPRAGGAALGVDRLLMCLADLPDIRSVRAFA
jgi:lysyl-tRNA synthetase class 2